MTKYFLTLIFVASIAAGTAIGYQPVEAVESEEVVTLTSNNFATLNSQVTDQSVAEVMSTLSELLTRRGEASYPIYLVLDTPGGSVIAGYRLYEFLKPYKNVHTITLNSYSMGAVLVELISGKRLMIETGTIMFHRMKLGVQGNTDEAQSQLDYSRTLEDLAESKIAARASMTREELRKKVDREWYMQAYEALKNKIIDQIIIVKCDKELLRSKTTKTVQPLPFFPPTEIEVSNCPLLF